MSRASEGALRLGTGQGEEAALPAMPAGAVPLGARLPTHLSGKLHKEFADLAFVQVRLLDDRGFQAWSAYETQVMCSSFEGCDLVAAHCLPLRPVWTLQMAPQGRHPTGAQTCMRLHSKAHDTSEAVHICLHTCSKRGPVLPQELDTGGGVVWAMAFSRRGRHLAAAGQDTVVRLWAVLEDRTSASDPQAQSPPRVFTPAPVRP